MLLLKGIEVITGIIPIKFHLQKLAKKSQIHPFKLPTNHILRKLMDNSPYHLINPILMQLVLLQINKRT